MVGEGGGGGGGGGGGLPRERLAETVISVSKVIWERGRGRTFGFRPFASTASGTSAQGRPLLASLPMPGRPLQPLQPQLDLKHLLPFRLNGSSPLSLFPNFSTQCVPSEQPGCRLSISISTDETLITGFQASAANSSELAACARN
ncbi:Zinc finger protein 385C [Liparis tanakae]|uniref:Zinc finger protein 385C n=1 Tax=Liparis tanakae TaxID=230148 RepID=A0A4Z2J7S3_9TELE|nr:Zinc finger protein 385C [Liparis tanakae]